MGEKPYKALEDLGASPETIKSMKQFFLKTSIPRIIEKRKQEESNDNDMNKKG